MLEQNDVLNILRPIVPDQLRGLIAVELGLFNLTNRTSDLDVAIPQVVGMSEAGDLLWDGTIVVESFYKPETVYSLVGYLLKLRTSYYEDVKRA